MLNSSSSNLSNNSILQSTLQRICLSLWNLGNGILLVVVFLNISTVPEVLGRYSKVYFTGALVTLIYAVGCVLLGLYAWRVSPLRFQLPRNLWLLVPEYRITFLIWVTGGILFTLALLPFQGDPLRWFVYWNLILGVVYLTLVETSQDNLNAKNAILIAGNLLAAFVFYSSAKFLLISYRSLSVGIIVSDVLGVLIASVAPFTFSVVLSSHRNWERSRVTFLSAGWVISLFVDFFIPLDSIYLKILILFDIAFAIQFLQFPIWTQTITISKRLKIIPVAALLLLLAMNFVSIPSSPLEHPGGDEVGWTNYALTWLRTGKLYYQMVDAPPIPITPGVGYSITVYARWISLVGAGFIQGRIFIWIIYIVDIICLAIAGSVLYDGLTGFLCALIGALSPVLFQARMIRPEIALPIFGSLVPALFLLSKKRPVVSFFLGWFLVLGLEVHAVALAYIIAGCGLYAYDTLQTVWSTKRIQYLFTARNVAFAAGLFVGGLIFIATHVLILPQPSWYFSFLSGVRTVTTVGSVPFVTPLSQILTLYWNQAPLELLVTIVGIAAMVYWRHPTDAVLLRYFAVLFIAYVTLIPSGTGYNIYLSSLTPMAVLSIASLARHGIKLNSTLDLRQIILVSAILLGMSSSILTGAISKISFQAWQTPLPELAFEIGKHVRKYSTKSDVVVGKVLTGYWGLLDYSKFYAYEAEYELNGTINKKDYYQMWTDLRPTVIYDTTTPSTGSSLPPMLRKFMQNEKYRVVDEFSFGQYHTTLWIDPEATF